MANAFLSEPTAAIGTTPTDVYTCPAATETTVIGLAVSNRVTSQIQVTVEFDATGRTSGAEDKVYLIKGAPVPVGSSLVVVGGDQKLVMEPGDKITVTCDTAGGADIVISHLDVT
jgi:hypothetical protein